jgi:hypothetical protein
MTVYDLVSQIYPSFVSRTDEEIFIGARRSVLPEVPEPIRQCDAFKD